MGNDLPSHSSDTLALIEALAADRDAMTKLGMAVLGSDGTPFFPLDFMAIAAVKRNVSISKALAMMVEAWNMVGARALLRIHIDTSLRFSAAWLVQDPHDFASKVVAGQRIDTMQDRDGKKLRDAHLVAVRSEDYPWLERVYGNLSGYVHFSGAHIYDTVTDLDDDTLTIQFLVSESDLKFPEFSWNEVLECSREANGMLAHFLRGYGATKRMSPDALAAARKAHEDGQ
jgi:hypothetical protein